MQSKISRTGKVWLTMVLILYVWAVYSSFTYGGEAFLLPSILIGILCLPISWPAFLLLNDIWIPASIKNPELQSLLNADVLQMTGVLFFGLFQWFVLVPWVVRKFRRSR